MASWGRSESVGVGANGAGLPLPATGKRPPGTHAECRVLEEAWRRAVYGQPQLVLVEGHRRVGKTCLLTHFARGRRSLLLSTTQQADAVELGRLVRAVDRQLGSRATEAIGSVVSWQAALERIFRFGDEEPLLVVMDELPHFARTVPDMVAMLTRLWETMPARSHLMLVLTGWAPWMLWWDRPHRSARGSTSGC
jgi:hypothetical protein